MQIAFSFQEKPQVQPNSHEYISKENQVFGGS